VIAGWGNLPIVVAEALRQQGRSVAGIGIRDHADPRLASLCDHFEWIGSGRLGRATRLFQRWGVSQATMVGKIHKVLFLQPRWWLHHTPDWKTLKAFAPFLLTGTKDGKDDTLLGIVVDLFAAEGIVFHPATDYAPELLVKSGQIAGRPLSAKQKKDVNFGWQLAKEMGRLDVGQTVCVKDQMVIAVEAIEGTDLCIRRAGQLCRRGGFTVVKVAKPQQDMRFDVPTVGIKTLEMIAAVGGKVLAIEADRTILLDGDEFARAAERLKISVVATNQHASAAVAA
jgi:UDP-2,3-diacylglucosamine hydrolase